MAPACSNPVAMETKSNAQVIKDPSAFTPAEMSLIPDVMDQHGEAEADNGRLFDGAADNRFQLESESQSESEPEKVPEPQSEPQSESEKIPESEAEPQSESESQSESKPEPQSESEKIPESESESQSQSESKPESEPQSESEVVQNKDEADQVRNLKRALLAHPKTGGRFECHICGNTFTYPKIQFRSSSSDSHWGETVQMHCVWRWVYTED